MATTTRVTLPSSCAPVNEERVTFRYPLESPPEPGSADSGRPTAFQPSSQLAIEQKLFDEPDKPVDFLDNQTSDDETKTPLNE